MKFIKWVPNILTGIRFVLMPFIVLAIMKEEYIAGIVLYAISSITDIADGIIARKFNAITDIGKLFDPLADKLTQIMTLVALTVQNIIPIWIVIVMLVKELSLVIGAGFLWNKKLVVSSKWYGKLTTVLLFIAVIFSLLIRIFNWYHFDIYIYILVLIFAFISLASYARYFLVKEYIKKK